MKSYPIEPGAAEAQRPVAGSAWRRAATAVSMAAVGLGLLAAVAGPVRAQPVPARFELITPAEARAEQQGSGASPSDGIRTRSLPGAPRTVPAIVVLAPSATAAVSAPIRIELAFQPVPGTRIVPSSFRVLYGVLKIDLTERLRRNAQISESGVVVEQAQVPDGLHRLFMQVSDDKGNQAEQELRLRVGAGS